MVEEEEEVQALQQRLILLHEGLADTDSRVWQVGNAAHLGPTQGAFLHSIGNLHAGDGAARISTEGQVGGGGMRGNTLAYQDVFVSSP